MELTSLKQLVGPPYVLKLLKALEYCIIKIPNQLGHSQRYVTNLIFPRHMGVFVRST